MSRPPDPLRPSPTRLNLPPPPPATPLKSPLKSPLGTRRRPPIAEAGVVTGVMLALMWIQELVDQFVLGGRMDILGIIPRDPAHYWHVFTAPFLHGDLNHLLANTVPFAVLAFMSAVRSISRFGVATFLITLVGGTLVWLFGRSSIHLGASELIFGYLAYLLGVGWWERTPTSIVIALAAFLLYGGILWGVLPGNPLVSWEAHLFGFVGGLVAALVLHGRRGSSHGGGKVA